MTNATTLPKGRQIDYDLLIRGGRVLLEHGVHALDIAVSEGRVSALLPRGTLAQSAQVVDADGCHVLPGLIDTHVHFRTPGWTSKEDWAHGSRAAVAGGITTVIDMPNTRPPLFTPKDAYERHALIDGSSLVDYRFHAGVDPERPDLITEFTPREAASVKVFLTGHQTAPHVVRDPETLAKVCRLSARIGVRVLCHAEDDGIFSLLDRWQGRPATFGDYERFRPRTGAIVAVARLLELSRRYGTAVHVLHVSSREEADLLAAAAAAGLPATFEVTPHHLTFAAGDTLELGGRLRLSPALREKEDRERLWTAVLTGQAATIGSDHAPHEAGHKLLPVAEVPPGLPGVQELLPAVYSGLHRRRPDLLESELLAVVIRVLATGPAMLFGLDHRKGRIAVGLDADFVLFDTGRSWVMDATRVYSRCKWSAYEGRTFIGEVQCTIRRGRVVYRQAPGEQAEFGPPDGEWLGS
jgi:dihydroorotase